MNEIAKQDKRVSDEPGTPVTAVALSQAYLDSQSAADKQYQLKVLSVTGVVKAKPAGNSIQLTGAAGGQVIDCNTSLIKMSQLKTVKVGDTVTVKGLFSYISNGPSRGIGLSYCELVTEP